MVSRLARRSGVAVVQIAESLFWKPETVFHVGVGLQHVEVFIMRDECWPNVTIYGFEPNPMTFSEVSANYPGKLLPFAMGNRHQDDVPFYQPDKHRDGSSLFRRTPQDKEYRVSVRTLDELFPEVDGSARLLWIDAEGNDLAVLQGGERFIAGVQMINIEMTGTPSGEGWGDQVTIHHWLRDHGFRRQWVHTQRIHVGQQDCIYVRDEIFDPHICCCPCQLEGFEPRACEGANLLTFYEVEVHRNGRAVAKRGGRQVPSKEHVVLRECTLRTIKDEPKRRRHYWCLRWCGYAISEQVAVESATEAAQQTIAGNPPEYVDLGKNL